MFSSSARRVALTTSPAPIACIATAAPRAVASKALSYQSHQRRLSSSKPSSPADGPKKIAESEAVAAAPSKSKGGSGGVEKVDKTRSSKKKAKYVSANSTVKSRDQSMLHLPSVPSTQHIAPKDIGAADFFSLYRPISLTKSFPTTVTDDAFAAIFTSRTKSNKTGDVISVLSRQVKMLDKYQKHMEENGHTQEQVEDMRAELTEELSRKADVQHLDSLETEASLGFPAHILSGKYRPFNPPPAPVPMDTTESLAAGAEVAEAELEAQHRTYTAVLTIEESTDSNGEVTYMAHSSPLVAELPPASPPTKFLERMQIRQERYREQHQNLEENDMLAISVKRQRKLKMKKHKYKKLMRRTRNLRRRLDRN